MPSDILVTTLGMLTSVLVHAVLQPVTSTSMRAIPGLVVLPFSVDFR